MYVQLVWCVVEVLLLIPGDLVGLILFTRLKLVRQQLCSLLLQPMQTEARNR
jgi:hypothetical protein